MLAALGVLVPAAGRRARQRGRAARPQRRTGVRGRRCTGAPGSGSCGPARRPRGSPARSPRRPTSTTSWASWPCAPAASTGRAPSWRPPSACAARSPTSSGTVAGRRALALVTDRTRADSAGSGHHGRARRRRRGAPRSRRRRPEGPAASPLRRRLGREAAQAAPEQTLDRPRCFPATAATGIPAATGGGAGAGGRPAARSAGPGATSWPRAPARCWQPCSAPWSPSGRPRTATRHPK